MGADVPKILASVSGGQEALDALHQVGLHLLSKTLLKVEVLPLQIRTSSSSTRQWTFLFRARMAFFDMGGGVSWRDKAVLAASATWSLVIAPF